MEAREQLKGSAKLDVHDSFLTQKSYASSGKPRTLEDDGAFLLIHRASPLVLVSLLHGGISLDFLHTNVFQDTKAETKWFF